MERVVNPQIEPLKLGDIVIFKGKGITFEILSRLLKLFEREWDRWGWHTAFISEYLEYNDSYIICEAVSGGVTESRLDLSDDIQVWRWFDEEPHKSKVRNFVNAHLGEKYDILVYPLTALAYLIRHYWHRPVPRLLDNSWSCWELLYYFCDDMSKPLAEDYDFPMISDLMLALDTCNTI